MNRKSLLALFAVLPIAGGAIVYTAANTNYGLTFAEKGAYKVVWNAKPETINGKTYFRGEEQTPFEVKLTNLAENQREGGMFTLSPNGTFRNITPIGGIKKITISGRKNDETNNTANEQIVDIRWGYEVKDSDEILWTERECFEESKDFTNANQKPSYFEFIPNDNDVTIDSIALDYECNGHYETYNNTFEFENAEIDGHTKGLDHACGNCLYYHPELSGSLQVNAMEAPATFKFVVNSDKDSNATFSLRTSEGFGWGLWGKKTHELIDLKVNGTPVEQKDLDYRVMTRHINLSNADGNWIYFKNQDARGNLSLKKGENIIEFTNKIHQCNFDAVKFITDAKLTDNTIPTLKNKFEFIKNPTNAENGELKITCLDPKHVDPENSITCHVPAIPTVKHGYNRVDKGDHYDIVNTISGKDYVIGTEAKVAEDVDTAKTYKFEAENAKIISGNTRGVDHLCPHALYFNPGLSGHACINGADDNTAHEYTFTSDKALKIKYDLRVSYQNTGDKALANGVEVKINDNVNDVEYVTSTKTQHLEKGDMTEYFHQAIFEGHLNIKKGVNKLVVTTKTWDRNFDVINLITSANLVDQTESTFANETKATFEIVKAPTLTENGQIKVACSKCGRTGDSNNLLNLKDGNYEKVEENGKTNYYVTICKQRILVASI